MANDFGDSVTVYAAGSKRLLRKISKHVVAPTALAFDSAGNLYVANAFNNTVTVYAPGSTQALRTIPQGIIAPYSVRFDHSGNLNVANSAGNPSYNGSVTIYAGGTFPASNDFKGSRIASLVGSRQLRKAIRCKRCLRKRQRNGLRRR